MNEIYEYNWYVGSKRPILWWFLIVILLNLSKILLEIQPLTHLLFQILNIQGIIQ